MTMTSPDFVEKLAAYVPMPVAQAIYRQPRSLMGPTARRFPAVVLFTDISGFTPLSELLSQAGPTGAEELTQLINQYFTQMIQIIQAYQGQVVKFSGDAMTVLFPAEGSSLEGVPPRQLAVRQAGECALALQAKMSDFANIATSRGRASLSMKVGIGAGEILECSIGGMLGRWEYVVGGDPLVQVGIADRQAQPGQIVLSPQAWAEAQPFFVGTTDAHNRGFINLHNVIDPLPTLAPSTLDWEQLSQEQQQLAQEALQAYIPNAIKARLDEPSEWLAELRRMVILFVGIGGLDYEAVDAGERLQEFLRAAQDVIYRFEGSLGKVAVDDKGTVLLALFGAPPLFHEDDVTRAIACAVGLQAVAVEQNLRMSIGITEGSMFAGPVGAPSRQEYTVIGDAVNLAARLMQYGRAGTIVIDEQVKERAGPHFTIESLGSISVKGKAKALPAYLVKGEEGAQAEFMTRYLLHDDPLVGRKAELEQIRRLAARTRTGKLQLLFIEGEPGLGKSRLSAEMVREWMMAGGVAYGSKCVSYDQHMPYQGWREILAAIFGLNPSLSPQRQLARLASRAADLPDPPEHPGYWTDRLPLLADVVGLEAPENEFTRHISGELRRDNTFAMVETILRHQTERHPLLILLEDVHWADELTLPLAAYVTQKLVERPLFLVLVHRPMPEADFHTLTPVRDLPYARTLYLEPLEPEESLNLIRILSGDKPLSPKAEATLLSRGQGNPFFLHEITGAILDGAERQKAQTFEWLETLELPETVQDVIFSRVDRLSEAEKLTLKIASVIGTSFQRSLLTQVHPMHKARLLLPSQLDSLEGEKLIRLEASAPKWEYTFRHIITQEVVYEGLLLAQRRQLHATVGLALEVLAPDEVERLAYHYSRSDHWDKALYYLKLAGQKAQREYANHAAIRYYSEILARLNDRAAAEKDASVISTEYWDILLERARLYHLIGWRDEEVEDLGTLGIMAEALKDDRRRTLVAKQWAYFYETIADYDSGLELVERAVTLAKRASDEKLLGEAYNQWGKLLYLRGFYETAYDYLGQAAAIAQNHHDKVAQADCLHNLGIVTHYQTHYDVALYFFQEAIVLWRTLGDQVSLGNGLRNLGRVYYDMGQYMTARHSYEEALALHKSIGDRAGEAMTQHNLGKIYRSLGNYEAAHTLFEEALVFYQSIGDYQREAHTLGHLGFLHSRRGEYETALTFLEKALVILRELNDPWALAKVLTYYGWTLYNNEQRRQAREHITEALKIERETQQEVAMMEGTALLGRIALSLNDLSLADACARHTLKHMRQHGTQGIEHPAMVYLTCYHCLQANQKFKQAQEVLNQAHKYIASQVAKIEDSALRKSYLTHIPEIRELVALAIRRK